VGTHKTRKPSYSKSREKKVSGFLLILIVVMAIHYIMEENTTINKEKSAPMTAKIIFYEAKETQIFSNNPLRKRSERKKKNKMMHSLNGNIITEELIAVYDLKQKIYVESNEILNRKELFLTESVYIPSIAKVVFIKINEKMILKKGFKVDYNYYYINERACFCIIDEDFLPRDAGALYPRTTDPTQHIIMMSHFFKGEIFNILLLHFQKYCRSLNFCGGMPYLSKSFMRPRVKILNSFEYKMLENNVRNDSDNYMIYNKGSKRCVFNMSKINPDSKELCKSMIKKDIFISDFHEIKIKEWDIKESEVVISELYKGKEKFIKGFDKNVQEKAMACSNDFSKLVDDLMAFEVFGCNSFNVRIKGYKKEDLNPKYNHNFRKNFFKSTDKRLNKMTHILKENKIKYDKLLDEAVKVAKELLKFKKNFQKKNNIKEYGKKDRDLYYQQPLSLITEKQMMELGVKNKIVKRTYYYKMKYYSKSFDIPVKGYAKRICKEQYFCIRYGRYMETKDFYEMMRKQNRNNVLTKAEKDRIYDYTYQNFLDNKVIPPLEVEKCLGFYTAPYHLRSRLGRAPGESATLIRVEDDQTLMSLYRYHANEIFQVWEESEEVKINYLEEAKLSKEVWSKINVKCYGAKSTPSAIRALFFDRENDKDGQEIKDVNGVFRKNKDLQMGSTECLQQAMPYNLGYDCVLMSRQKYNNYSFMMKDGNPAEHNYVKVVKELRRKFLKKSSPIYLDVVQEKPAGPIMYFMTKTKNVCDLDKEMKIVIKREKLGEPLYLDVKTENVVSVQADRIVKRLSKHIIDNPMLFQIENPVLNEFEKTSSAWNYQGDPIKYRGLDDKKYDKFYVFHNHMQDTKVKLVFNANHVELAQFCNDYRLQHKNMSLFTNSMMDMVTGKLVDRSKNGEKWYPKAKSKKILPEKCFTNLLFFQEFLLQNIELFEFTPENFLEESAKLYFQGADYKYPKIEGNHDLFYRNWVCGYDNCYRIIYGYAPFFITRDICVSMGINPEIIETENKYMAYATFRRFFKEYPATGQVKKVKTYIEKKKKVKGKTIVERTEVNLFEINYVFYSTNKETDENNSKILKKYNVTLKKTIKATLSKKY